MSNSNKVLPLMLPATLILASNTKLLTTNNLFTSVLNPKKINVVLNPKRINAYAEQSEKVMNKFSNTVDIMKKINRLNEIHSLSSEEMNKDNKVQEIFSTLKEISPNNYYEKFDSLENTLNIVKKISKAKKILDIQKSITSNESSSSQNPIGLLKSLSNSNALTDKDNSLEKIIKMATLFSNLTNENK